MTKAKSGSPTIGEPEYLVVGRLRRPHGLAGEMLMEVVTDFPERLVPGLQVFVGEQHAPMIVATIRSHAKGLIVQFKDLDSRDLAAVHRNQEVCVRTQDRPPLPAGEYYHHELLGCRVFTEAMDPLGRLVEIIETGANDVYVVRAERGGDLLLPAIENVILAVDPNRRTVLVRVPPQGG